jgi:hypothetical protein
MELQFSHIALQKNLCLLGVIFMHALLPFTGFNPFWMIYADQPSEIAVELVPFAFAVLIPSFIFASGFLLANSLEYKQRTLTEHIKNRVKRLLLPWLLAILFWLVPLYTLFDLPAFNRPLHTTLVEGYILSLSGLFNDHLWFLLVLFWVTLFWLVALPIVRQTNQFIGVIIAIIAALLMEHFGNELIWYCLNQTSALIIFFYFGCLVYWNRERIDSLLMRFPLPLFFALTITLAVLSNHLFDSFSTLCLISCLGCVFSYLLSLILIQKRQQTFHAFLPYRYFEENAFRFYIFHMPTGLLIFQIVNKNTELPALLQILIIFLLCFCITSFIVMASRYLEEKGKAILSQNKLFA